MTAVVVSWGGGGGGLECVCHMLTDLFTLLLMKVAYVMLGSVGGYISARLYKSECVCVCVCVCVCACMRACVC